MEKYLNKKVIVKNDLIDEELELNLKRGTIATIRSIECEVDGFGTDYVNIITENGEKYSGISTYELELI